MYSENGVMVDLDDVHRVIASCDVFSFGFAEFPERLLVDARTDDNESPLIQVVEPAGSAQERLAWLERRRPALGAPRTFTFVLWPHSPGLLVESGIWARVTGRVGADSDETVRAQCEQALKQLHKLDHAATIALLRGENCTTLWPKEEDR
jgi:hypothetical protein